MFVDGVNRESYLLCAAIWRKRLFCVSVRGACRERLMQACASFGNFLS